VTEPAPSVRMASTTAESIPADVVAPVPEAETQPESAAPKVVVEEHRPSLFESLHEAWRCRHLFWQIASAVLLAVFTKLRLGPFWILFATFMSLIGYTLIFGGGVFNVATPNGMPYFLFMLVGMMGWQLFQQTLTISARSFLRLKRLVKEIHMPLILVPIAGSAQALLRFFLLLIVYVMAVIYYWVADGKIYAQLQPKFLFFTIVGLFLCVTLAWGISLWTAPLTAHTRDVRYLVRYLVPFWMFVTPVLYPIDHLKGTTRLIAEINPLSSPIEMAKVGMLGAGSVRLYAAIWSFVSISLVFASGVWFMNRYGARVVGLYDNLDEDDEDLM
jgi:homopolymeric O-antigen transport system permease protein